MSKERLTEKSIGCFGYRLKDGSDAEVGFFKDYGAFYSHMMVVKALGEYETLEEQGLLLRLPVAVGGSIWDNDFGSPYRYEVTGFSYGDINEDDCDYDEELQTDELIVHYRNHNGSITGKFPISENGKTVFLTQSEAEEKLRELERK